MVAGPKFRHSLSYDSNPACRIRKKLRITSDRVIGAALSSTFAGVVLLCFVGAATLLCGPILLRPAVHTILSTTRNRAFPLVIRSYASFTCSSG